MTERYCIIIAGREGQRVKLDFIPGRDKLALVMEDYDKPRTFGSIDDAVKIADKFKRDSLDTSLEVRKYLGPSSRVWEFQAYGNYKVGKNILERI